MITGCLLCSQCWLPAVEAHGWLCNAHGRQCMFVGESCHLPPVAMPGLRPFRRATRCGCTLIYIHIYIYTCLQTCLQPRNACAGAVSLPLASGCFGLPGEAWQCVGRNTPPTTCRDQACVAIIPVQWMQPATTAWQPLQHA